MDYEIVAVETPQGRLWAELPVKDVRTALPVIQALFDTGKYHMVFLRQYYTRHDLRRFRVLHRFTLKKAAV